MVVWVCLCDASMVWSLIASKRDSNKEGPVQQGSSRRLHGGGSQVAALIFGTSQITGLVGFGAAACRVSARASKQMHSCVC